MNAIKIKLSRLAYLFVLLSIFILVKSKISLVYPHGVNLNSGAILIIHKFGITIYNSDITSIIKEIEIFKEDELIEEEGDLSKITLEIFNGYIFSIIKDKIYIFNEQNGDLMYNSSKIINKTKDAEYYTLAPVNITNNTKYSYIIGYADTNNLLNLFYYEYDSQLQENQLITSKTQFKYEDKYAVNNRGLSCLYMKPISYNYNSNIYEALVCFFSITLNKIPYLITSFYVINKNNISKHNKYTSDQFSYKNNIKNITNIKSSANKDKTRSLVCFYDNTKEGNTYCIKYCLSYQYDNFYGLVRFISTPCRNEIYAIDVRFFSQKNDIIFSCVGNEGILQAAIFDRNLNNPSSSIKNFYSCQSIFGFSLIYNNNGSYNIISDVKCNGTEYPLVGLGQVLIQNEEIAYEEINEEKETINVEEILLTDSIVFEESIIVGTEIEIKESEKNDNKCSKLEKCEICDEESLSKNLCLKCNISGGYYPLYNEIFSQETQNLLNNNYIDCVNNETKPSNYYLNKELENYSPCFETCATCDYGGNGIEHNCTSCDFDLIKRPEFNYSKNCVVKCSYYYYYTSYGQYKCSNSSQCPNNRKLLVRDIGKCTNNCKNENLYKYQYNGECLKQCPEHTQKDENFICKDLNNKCYLTKYDIHLNHHNIDNEIETIVQNYAKEFNYTEKHVSIFNDEYNEIIIYKNDKCLHELNLHISEINFGLCYNKIQVKFKMRQNLIIVLIIQKTKDQNIKANRYQVYNPITGEKIPYEEICEDDSAIVQENIFQKINSSSFSINTILFLTKQKVDIFNLSCPFYIDICYNFETYNKKDIALKDRVSIFFPNISLCENGCQIKSINLTSLKANCECKINKLIGNDIFAGNILYENQLDEIDSLIRQTNINIIKCYKYALYYTYFIRNISGYIIGFLVLIQIIFTILYYKRSFYLTKKYIFILIEKYLQYLDNLVQKNNISPENNSFYLCEVDSYNKNNNININKNGPPIRKKRKSYVNRNNLRLNLSDENITSNITNNIINNKNNNLNNDIDNNLSNNNNKANYNINTNIINNMRGNINNNETNNDINNNTIRRKKARRASKIYKNKKNSKKRVSMPIDLYKFNNLKGNNKITNNNNLKENKFINNYDNFLNGDNLLVLSGSRLINPNNSNSKRSSLKDSSRGGTKLNLDENFNMSKDILSKNKIISESFKDLKEEDLNIKIDIEEYLSTDLDDMDFDDAIKRDQRKFSTYLYDKLKSSQIILNTFYNEEPLRPKPIKILLFILDIDLYFLVNGLFFNEEYISEIYHLEEEETFFSFIPRCWNRFLYATLVGGTVNYVIDCFFIDEKKIKGIFKREKENTLFLKYETISIIKELNKRYSCFIILSFVVTIFTWYYVSCFNYVYKYSRNEWIKSTIVIIIVMQLISVLTCLLESIIRFLGFKLKSEKIYKISLLL